MPALTRQRIIETAVALADGEGLDAVTLRRIAGQLGVHVTSLYNHVPTREAVTEGIVEMLIDEAKLPGGAVDWEQWVRMFYDSMATIAVTHPGAVAAFQRRPVQGSSAASSFEVALQAFTRAGLDPSSAYSALKATTMVTLSMCSERALQAAGKMVETEVDDLPVESFPLIHQVRECADPETAWSFALEALVAGLRTQIRHHRVQMRQGESR